MQTCSYEAYALASFELYLGLQVVDLARGQKRD